MSKEIVKHQDDRGTIHELTIHDSLPQNGTVEQSMRTHAKQVRSLNVRFC